MANEIVRRGWNQTKLALKVGVSRSSISYLLSEEQTWASRLVPAVHEALGWPPPERASPTDDMAEIRRLWPELTPEQRALVQSLAAQLAQKK